MAFFVSIPAIRLESAMEIWRGKVFYLLFDKGLLSLDTIESRYEVDPLRCWKCGGEMRIVSFIEAKTQADVIKRILKHCGLWKEIVPQAPPIETKPPVSEREELQYDYTFFDRICA